MHPLKRITLLSRPRFWHYLLGPWVVGFLMGLDGIPAGVQLAEAILWGLWWLLPANIFLYGINDVFDYETDKNNPKKQGKELLLPRSWHRGMLLFVGLFILGSLIFSLRNTAILLSMSAFLFLGTFYSAPPLRFKSRPFLDMMSNALYALPALHGYFFTGASTVSLTLFVAGVLWCMAMHAFSAIPDISFDKQAGIRTTATSLGKSRTLLLCAFLYGLGSILVSLSSPVVGLFALLYALLCLVIRALSPSSSTLTKIYWLFPWLNLFFGAIITLRVLYNFVV